MSDRFSRKEIKHDRFVEEVGTAYAVARRHASLILAAIGGVLLLIAVIVGVLLYLGQRERKAQGRLAEAIEILEAPVAPAGETAPAAGTYRSEEEKIAKAEPILKEVVAEYGGRDAADVANLYLARLDVQRDQLDAARQKYVAFIDEHPRHVLAAAARMTLFELRLAAGENDQVIAEIEKELAGREPALPADAALTVLARAHTAANQPARAREAYQRIVNEYPDSPYTIEAQRRLAQ